MQSIKVQAVKISNGVHKSVLLKEAVDGLNLKKGDTVVDATVNGGGVSLEILRRLGGEVKLVCIDADSDALAGARKRIEEEGFGARFLLGNFRDIDKLLSSENISLINGIVYDLGLSSNQLESSGRGFSFGKDEPLLMTFSKNPREDELTASDIVNDWEGENIETIIRAYGEEPRAWKISKAICEARKIKPIKTSRELAEIIERAIRRHGKTHPATKTFQALRIAVNNELENLKKSLTESFKIIAPGGRMAVISFHSLEDRVVKNFIRERAREGGGIAITKKPTRPSKEEIMENPRSRSGKLRIIEKVQ